MIRGPGMGSLFAYALADYLAAGTQRLPTEFRRRQTAYVLDLQLADGGFAHRAGNSDLYYTVFAARLLRMLGVDAVQPWTEIRRFVLQTFPRAEELPDVLALFEIRWMLAGITAIPPLPPEFAAWTDAAVAELETDQTTATAGPHAVAGLRDLYSMFLCEMILQLGERQPLSADIVVPKVAGVLATLNPGAGPFDESAPGVNPLAAGLALLVMADASASHEADRVVDLLLSAQLATGGFTAWPGGTEPDLLSTFSATVALGFARNLARVRRADIVRFVRGLACPNGGFKSSVLDSETDVEYTYYGVSILGLLAEWAASNVGL